MSLSSLFEKMTFNLDEIVVKVAIKTGVKLKNTNYTIFVFSQDHQNIANGDIICFIFFNFFPKITEELCVMERSTVVSHRKGSGIGDYISECLWARWWMVCSVGGWGCMRLCAFGGYL